MASQALRDLFLSIAVKVDKTAVKETDKAFAQATKSAAFFENGAYKALEPLKKIGSQLDANARKARAAFEATFKSTGFAMPPPRPPSRKDKNAIDFAAIMAPKPPRPGEFAGTLAPPNIDDFLDKRSGPQRAFDELREKARGAFASMGSAAERFNSKFDGTVKAIFNARNAFMGLAIVAAGAAILHFVGGVVEAGAELHTMAQRTRMSVETLQVWRQVAAGVNADSGAVTQALRKLSAAMANASKGGKAQAAAFKELGVSTSGRDVEDVLIDTGSALAAMDDDAKASALAVQLLGANGAALVPAFAKGAESVRALTAELRENVAMNAEEAARLEEVGSAVERGTKKWTALKTRAIVLLLPLLEALSSAFESVSKWVLRMAKETSTLQTILAAIAAGGLARLVSMFVAWVSSVGGARAALVAFGGSLETVAGIAMRLILPFLVIEDFLTFLAGGKSIFGRAMEEMFGAGGANEKRKEFLDFFNQIAEAAKGLADPLAAISNSGLFKGAVKTALDGILLVLKLIGLALTDNTGKADALASSMQGLLGIGPSKETKEKLTQGHQAQMDAVREGRANPLAPTQGPGWISKTVGTLLGVDHNAIRERAEARARTLQAEGVVPAPAAPPTPRGVVINDQRKVEVNVGANATPGATGRAVGGAVNEQLTKDRRQTLNAL